MKFLANENFPAPSIQILKEHKLDLKAIADEMPGISDQEVMNIAGNEGRIILTFDKDYGELIFKYGMKQPVSVVFFRYKGNDPEFAGNFLMKLLSDATILLTNNFTVVEEQSIRQRGYKNE